MMKCREVAERVTDYLEGGLAGGDRFRFRLHIAMCRHCRRYLRQMKALVGALALLPDETIAEDAYERIVRHFRN